MIIHDIADYLVNLTCKDIKPDIYSVFDSPYDNNCPNNVNSEKLTILEILNAIGCRLKNLFGFVKINTTTETIDEGEAIVNVSGDVDNLNFDFKIPHGKTGPQGPTGPGVATGGTTGQVLAKKSDANYDTEWVDNAGGGSTVSVNVGETTTGEPGTNANVTNSGDETNVVLNFTIPRGDPGPENLVIITATASTTVQGEYIPDTTYTKALADIQANKAVMIKLENVPGRYYIPYSSSNAEILASAGTVSGSNQSIELYLLKWAAQGNIITLAGTKEGCIADGGTAGQVLTKKSDESFDTEWKLQYKIILSNQTFNTAELIELFNNGTLIYVYNVSTKRLYNITLITKDSLFGINEINFNSPSNQLIIYRCTISDKIYYYTTYAYSLPSGGTTDQILAKKSNTDGDAEWIDPPSGSTVSVNVGTTTTGEAGTNANVTNSGDETNVVLNFTIPRGDPGPENLVIITATASTTVQGEYIPDTTYTKALADIQANKAVMIKLENVPGRYYIPYSSSNAEILASAGTVSGSNQSIELYLLKWAAQGNIITLAGTKEGCIADGGTAGQVLAKKSDANYDTEWVDVPNSGGLTKTILWTNPNPKNEMAGTQLVLSDFVTNYKLITIEYLLSTTLQKVITTVYNKNTDFTETRLYYYDGYRDVKIFGQTLFVTNGWNLKTNDYDKTQVIPLRIVAYD